MTAFSQHISFFLSCLEEKASWCKHEIMCKLSKSHLNRVRISMLGLVFEFYFIFYFPIAVGGKKQNTTVVSQYVRRDRWLLCWSVIAVKSLTVAPPFLITATQCPVLPPPQLLVNLRIYDKEWTGGELTLSHPWNLSPTLLTCFQWWKILFESSEVQSSNMEWALCHRLALPDHLQLRGISYTFFLQRAKPLLFIQ